MVRAYDLDGTLRGPWPKRPKPFFHQTGEERRAFDEMCQRHCQEVECLMVPPPDEPYVIITSCHPKFIDNTLEWLEQHGFSNYTIEFIDRARVRQNMIDFKAEMIDKYGVTVYYEDDVTIARALRKRCPGVMIILVPGSAPEGCKEE
jgi:hypothetical protein